MILVVYLLVHSADTEILPTPGNLDPAVGVGAEAEPVTVVTVTRDML